MTTLETLKKLTKELPRKDEALFQSEEMFRMISEQSLAGITLTQGAKVVYMNEAILKMVGISDYEKKGRSICEFSEDVVRTVNTLVHPDYRHIHEKMYMDMMEGKITEKSFEFKVLTLKGERWLSSQFRVINYKDQSAVLGVYIDVTESKNMALALEESELKYKTIFNDSPAAMSVTRKGILIDVNPSWLKLHGFEEREAVMGKDIISVVHDKKALEYRRKHWKVEAEKSFFVQDVTRDGSVINVEVCSNNITIRGEDVILATVLEKQEDSNVKGNP